MTKPIDIKGTRQAQQNILSFPSIKDQRTGDGNDDIFDMRAINTIREMEQQTGNALLPSVLDGFISQMQAKLGELSDSIEQADAAHGTRIANAIRSMSANIGAEKVRQISTDIEAQCRGGEFTLASKALAALAMAFEEFVERFALQFLGSNHDRL